MAPTTNGAGAVPAALTAFLLLVSLIIVLTKLSTDSPFDSNILSLFPSEYDSKVRAEAGHNLQQLSERRISILASAEHGVLAEALLQRLAHELRAEGLVEENRKAFDANVLSNWYRPYRYQLLNADQRHYFRTASTEDIAHLVLRDLYSPFSSVRAYSLADDPFGITGGWFQQLRGNYTMSNGRLGSVQHSGRAWFVLDLTLSQNPFDLDTQQGVSAVLERVLSASEANDNIDVLSSGMFFHAAAGAELARSEVQSLGVLSLLAITLLVLAAFRSLQVLLVICMLLLGSITVALAACLVVFDKVNLITLAFGTSLLGIAVDYAFHYFCLYRTGINRFSVARRIRGGVLLSMFSTILAYTMQFGSPFPGLHQFAVFVIAGIISAGLMVIYLVPHLLANNVAVVNSGGRSQQLFVATLLPAIKKFAAHRTAIVVGLMLMAAIAIVTLLRHGSNDDIKSLNTSSDALMQTEAKVSDILSRPGGLQYFILQGSPEQRLQNAEAVMKNLTLKPLHGAQSNRASRTAFSIARFIPSQAQQRADYNLLMSRLYSEGGVSDTLCELDKHLCPIVSAKPEFDGSLVPTSVPPMIAERFGFSLLSNAGFDVLLPPRQLTSMELEEAVDGLDQVQAVDRATELSSQLGLLRVQIMWLVSGFLCCLALIVLYAFSLRGLIVIVPLVLSVLLALSLAPAAGVTLFHLLAVLLVMGLTIDAAIFYLKLGFNHDVWLAVSLSSMTSMCAFGLLSYSAVPVLAQFGAVVFVGLLSAWFLIPLVYCVVEKTDS